MIAVIDYGMGNLRSVSKALEHLGAEVCVTGSAEQLRKASKIVLPGVGAFKDAMTEINSRQLKQTVLEAVQSGKPFLGICLGLQLLLSESEENPGVCGLNIFEGPVRRFRSQEVKVPHMGWNRVSIQFEHPLFAGIPDKSYFYFVHSYFADPADSSVRAGLCEYGGENFSAVLAHRNIFATQFHPEKSQDAGLRILKNFIDWKP